MAKKEFTYRGKKIEELKELGNKAFAALLPSRERRTLNRGFTEPQKKLLAAVKKEKKNIETHCRDMVILPEMVGTVIKVHNGKEFVTVRVEAEMLGHRLGEFALTRKGIKHSAPGVGATRSSSSLSVR